MLPWLASRAVPEPNTGCWLWTGALDRAGYGRTTGGVAHRKVWRLYGRVVDGFDQVLHHRCGVRRCVNPAHLEVRARAEHSAEHQAPRKVTPEHRRAINQAIQRRWKQRRLAVGGCIHCLEPATIGQYCQPHAVRARAVKRAQRARRQAASSGRA